MQNSMSVMLARKVVGHFEKPTTLLVAGTYSIMTAIDQYTVDI